MAAESFTVSGHLEEDYRTFMLTFEYRVNGRVVVTYKPGFTEDVGFTFLDIANCIRERRPRRFLFTRYVGRESHDITVDENGDVTIEVCSEPAEFTMILSVGGMMCVDCFVSAHELWEAGTSI